MNKPSSIGAGLALALAAVLLAGCGSSSDDNNNGNTPVNPDPNPGPTASVDPTIALVRQLVAQGGNNTAEPVVLSNRAFVTSDTTEPEAL